MEDLQLDEHASTVTSYDVDPKEVYVQSRDQQDSLSWSGNEYVPHVRGPLWFLSLGGIAAALSVAMYFITKTYFSAIVSGALVLLLGAYSLRKPQVLQYTLTKKDLRINEKSYDLELFKSFAVHAHDGFYTIELMPIKRLMPTINIYCLEDVANVLSVVLSEILPNVPAKNDWIESLMHRLRM